MQKRSVVFRVSFVALAAVTVFLGPLAGVAFAGGQGNYGSCGANGTTIGCGVGVGGGSGNRGSGTGHPGTGTPGGSASGNTGRGSSGANPVSCTSTPVQNGAPPAGAGPGGWFLVICASNTKSQPGIAGSSWNIQWMGSGQAPPPPPPPPDPAQVAATAESQISLPNPSLNLAPAAWGVVNLPEWLWLPASYWQAVSTSATACNGGGCVTATATATPQYVVWSMGDGASATCYGPGSQMNFSIPVSSQSTSCSHTYLTTSAGQPSRSGDPNDAAYPITATVYWSGSWSASGAASGAGTFGPLSTSASTSLRVEQIQSVNTDH